MEKRLESEIETEESLVNQIKELEVKLEARRTIDQAKRHLMEQGLTEEEAYSRMRKASMDSRKPLSEIAEAVLMTASLEK